MRLFQQTHESDLIASELCTQNSARKCLLLHISYVKQLLSNHLNVLESVVHVLQLLCSNSFC